MRRRLPSLSLVLGTLVAMVAGVAPARAQVFIAAPAPPWFLPPPPLHVYIRQRVRWHLRHLPSVYIGAPPVVVQAPAYPVYETPPPPPLPPVPPPIVAPPPPAYYYYAPPPPPQPTVVV